MPCGPLQVPGPTLSVEALPDSRFYVAPSGASEAPDAEQKATPFQVPQKAIMRTHREHNGGRSVDCEDPVRGREVTNCSREGRETTEANCPVRGPNGLTGRV